MTIAGTSGLAPLTVSGGGSAASLGVTGNVALSGGYATGPLSVGASTAKTTTNFGFTSSQVSYTAGMFGVGTGASVTATTVNVVDGTATVSGAGAGLSASGAVTLGAPASYTNTLSGSTFSSTNDPGATGTLSIAAGAALSAASTVAVANGSLSASGAGTTATLGADLTLGTAPASSTSGSPSGYGTTGSLSVSGGAKARVAGTITQNYAAATGNAVSVSGAGTSLAATGGLTIYTNGYGYGAGLSATAGASVRLGSLTFRPGVSTGSSSIIGAQISVDRTSTVEIGIDGGAAAGTLTIDEGQTVASTTDATLSAYDGSIVDDGILSETGGTLTLNGALTGTGSVQIGANGTVALNGSAAASNTIAFAGGAAALEIGRSYGYSGYYGSGYSSGTDALYAVSSTLTGFATGDGILLDRTSLTSAVYASTGASTGTLTLYDGTAAVETLTLAGDYAGRTFAISPTSNGGSVVTLLTDQPGTASPASTGTDAYSWIGPSGGLWNAAANWADTTNQTDPAAQPPGVGDPVTIAGTSGPTPLTVSGGGSAASLGVTGNVALSGGYNAGALAVGASSAKLDQYGSTTIAYTAGTLGVGSSSTVSATTVNVVDGAATVSGAGAGLSASGTVTVGAPASYTSTSTATTYSSTNDPGATGALSIAAGAAFSAASTVAVANGSLSVSGAGTTATLGADLTLGTAPTSSASGSPSGYGTTGSLSVSGGAAMTVAGTITQNYAAATGNAVSVSGAGTTLAATGGLTVYVSGYGYGAGLSATAGGSVRLGSLAFRPGASTGSSTISAQVSVDGSSSVEVGTAGNAKAGTLTVDAGQTVASTTDATLSAYMGSIVDDGTLSETGGTLTLNGALTGTGSVQIGASSTVALNGSAAASNTIAFAGSAATLEIGRSYGYSGTSATAPYAVSSTLTGFATGDGILLDRTSVTSAVYASTGTNTGTLTLYDGTAAVETLTLAGDYAGRTFAVNPTSSGGTTVTLLAAGGETSVVSTGTDAYVWIGTKNGSWNDAANWSDTTSHTSPATTAPGIGDPVTIAGTSGSAPLTVSGGGSAASLGVTGNVALSGGYNAGALAVGASSAKLDQYGSTTIAYTAGTLGVGSSSTVSATTVNVVDGAATVSGAGAGLSASGTVTVGAPASYTSTSTATTYSSTNDPGATGALSIAAGAAFSAASTVAVANGSLSVSGAGTTATLGADLTLGTAPTSSASGSPSGYGTTGSLSVSGGAAMTVAGTITQNYAAATGNAVSVSGAGTTLAATGGLTVYVSGYGYGAGLSATAGGSVRLGSLAFRPGASTGSSTISAQVSVDGSSSVEVGTAGNAKAGTLTVDAGQTVASTTDATLSAYMGSIVDDGTLSETGGTLTLNGALTGTGSVQIGASSTVALNGSAAASNTIAFAGSAATLEIGRSYGYSGTSATAPYAVSSTLTGFATGDGILLDRTSVTSAVYASTGTNTGTLTLYDGTAAVETLTLAGDYAGRTFAVNPTSSGGTTVTLLAANIVTTAQPPVLTLSGSTGTVTNPTERLSGTIDAADAGQTISIYDNGGSSPVATATAGANGAWSASVALQQGSNTLVAQASNGSGTGSSQPLTVTYTPTTSGFVVDGYLAGATIFEDANGNGKLDPGEASTTTAADGSFTLPASPAPLVAVGGTDTSTGLANTATLMAPTGSSVVTPLTTLVSAVAAQNGGDVAAAQSKVLSAFGLSSDTNLLTLDPVAATQAGTPGTTAAYIASTQAAVTVSLLSAAGSTAGYAAIASTIAQSTGTVDLASATALTTIGSAAGLTGTTLGSTVALVQSSNASLASAAASTAAPGDLLNAVAAAQTTSQGTVASNLAAAVSTGDTAALQQLVSAYAPAASTAPTQPVTPTEPVASAGSTTPTAPVTSTEPVASAGSTTPTAPATSTEPVASAGSTTPTAPVTPAGSTTLVGPSDAVSLSSQVSYRQGVFTLTGHASSTVGVAKVEISAVLDDGTRHDLGAATLGADGTFTFQDRIGAHLQGFFAATETDAKGGTATSVDPDFSLVGGLRGDGFTAQQSRYTADGQAETSTSAFRPGGGRRVDVHEAGQTFASGHDDVFDNHAAPDNTFLFDPGYGHDVVNLFRVHGSDHDTLNLSAGDFGNSIARVLRNTHDTASGAVIFDPVTHDTVKLTGLTKQQLVLNQGDFAFH